MTTVLRCAGRARDSRDQLTGPACGRTLHHVGDAPIEEQARAAGWRLGPATAGGSRVAMCDRCARPDHTGPAQGTPAELPAQMSLLDLPGDPHDA